MSEATALPLGQVSHAVSDLDRAVKFFRDEVGLPLLFKPRPTSPFS